MKKLLYFLQVPWDWVKQRPHFIAEALAERYDVTVVHNKPYTRFKLVRNPRPYNLALKELYVLPFAYLSRPNSFLISRQLRKMIGESEVVWITHPFQYHQVKDCLSSENKVVYDCMDNFLEFDHVKRDPALRKQVAAVEQQLVERSDIIITSSQYIKDMLATRYRAVAEPHVVNNAIAIDEAWTVPASAVEHGERVKRDGAKITYIGTIAPWFDFELVLESLEHNDSISYHLYGPRELSIPKHERLIHHGPVPHEQLLEIMSDSDALVMPFKMNDLVLAVNPVKLYEYAFSHRPAIAVHYPETEQFNEFVHLYRTKEEYFDLLAKVSRGELKPKRSQMESLAFARNNTWHARANAILEILNARD